MRATAVLLLCLAVACDRGPSGPTTPVGTGDPDQLLRYEVVGGIAGLQDRLTIWTSGLVTLEVRDRLVGATALSAAQRAALDAYLDRTRPIGGPLAPTDPGAADAMAGGLWVAGRGQTANVQTPRLVAQLHAALRADIFPQRLVVAIGRGAPAGEGRVAITVERVLQAPYEAWPLPQQHGAERVEAGQVVEVALRAGAAPSGEPQVWLLWHDLVVTERGARLPAEAPPTEGWCTDEVERVTALCGG